MQVGDEHPEWLAERAQESDSHGDSDDDVNVPGYVPKDLRDYTLL